MEIREGDTLIVLRPMRSQQGPLAQNRKRLLKTAGRRYGFATIHVGEACYGYPATKLRPALPSCGPDCQACKEASHEANRAAAKNNAA